MLVLDQPQRVGAVLQTLGDLEAGGAQIADWDRRLRGGQPQQTPVGAVVEVEPRGIAAEAVITRIVAGYWAQDQIGRAEADRQAVEAVRDI